MPPISPHRPYIASYPPTHPSLHPSGRSPYPVMGIKVWQPVDQGVQQVGGQEAAAALGTILVPLDHDLRLTLGPCSRGGEGTGRVECACSMSEWSRGDDGVGG